MKHSTEIYRKLMILMMRSKRHMHEVVDTLGMTPVQGMLLMHFEKGQCKSMQELSTLMGCDASNTTGLIDRLDGQGLIERTVDPKDRRVKMIKLSDKGCVCRGKILESLQKAEAADLEKLSPDEVKTLVTLVDKLLA